MTRDEFIDAYMANRKLPREWRTGAGYTEPDGWKRVAMECHCDSESCNGWAMIDDNERALKDHLELEAMRLDV
jgi:hypothetical protein